MTESIAVLIFGAIVIVAEIGVMVWRGRGCGCGTLSIRLVGLSACRFKSIVRPAERRVCLAWRRFWLFGCPTG